jgi:thiol-disulfide isomerase/thioredoxin/YHS domain-containing protein
MRLFAVHRIRFPALLATACLLHGAVAPSSSTAAAAAQDRAAATHPSSVAVWQTDLQSAAKLSRKENRLLLMHFYASWCGPCRQMERETFAAADFGKQVGNRFVLVRINSDRHPGLVRQYGVTGLPCDVFVSPEGRILSRSAGYQSKRQYFAQLARWESWFAKYSKVQVAAQDGSAATQPSRVAAQDGSAATQSSKAAAHPDADDRKTTSSNDAPAAPQKVLIGMDGYSPVAMHRDRQWIAGKKQFAARHHGISYWMADADELAAFQRDPGRFAPKLLGCDPVVLNETDRAIPGKVRYGAIFDGELFFFTSADSRAKFRKDPLTYTRTRHVLRVNDINGTVRR